jgi:hypothetical protein
VTCTVSASASWGAAARYGMCGEDAVVIVNEHTRWCLEHARSRPHPFTPAMSNGRFTATCVICGGSEGAPLHGTIAS